jgi:hypothetical protein
MGERGWCYGTSLRKRDNCGCSLEGLTIAILPSVFNFVILLSVLKK